MAFRKICYAISRIGRSPFSRHLTSSLAVSNENLMDVATIKQELSVFLVAGEVSGDKIGSALMNSLKRLSPFPVRFAGVGGSMMCKQGLEALFPFEEIAIMGIWELLPHLYNIKIKLKETVEAAFLFRPDVVVTIDSKGFSLRLLRRLRAKYIDEGLDAPLSVHYVAPSFWAWSGGESRLSRLKNFVDHILCILPFEAEVCSSHGLNATYVGHPVLEDALMFNMGTDVSSNHYKVPDDGSEFRSKYGVPSGVQSRCFC